MNKKRHINYYFVEVLVLGLGFFAVYLLESLRSQIIGVSILVTLYVLMGVLHHYMEHDIKRKIMLEYIIVSVLILSLFIFLKSGVI